MIGRWNPPAPTWSARRQPAPPRRPYVAPPAPKVTRLGLRVRLVLGGLDVRHRYPSRFQARRMELVLRTSEAARRRFIARFGREAAR